MRSLAAVQARKRGLARIGTACLMLVLLNCAADARGRPLGSRSDRIVATPVPLDPGNPGRTAVGRLRYLGGWVLTSPDDRFGGLSSLVLDGGGRFLSVSDTGSFARFRMEGGRPTDTANGELFDCPRDCRTKFDRDAESTARDPATGTVWIGFENSNEIWRYGPDLGRSTGHVARSEMRKWPLNGGAESLVRLRDGRFLAIGETAKGPRPGTRPLLIFPGDPVSDPRPALVAGYRPPAGSDPSDAAELPDGRIVVLNRHVSLMEGFVSIVTVIDPAGLKPGQVLDGKPLATLAPPLTVDNMEGVAATREGARTVLWIISDDNFMPFERTLLLKFALEE